MDPQPPPDWIPPAGARARRSGPAAYVRAIFTDPFVATPERLFALSRHEFERQRRARLLRLILFSVALVLIFPVIPAALVGQTPALFRLTVVSELLLACVCLFINSRGYETLSAAIFCFCTLFLGLDFAVRNPDGLTIQVYLIYAILALVPLIAGLVLPIWVIWLAGAMLVGITIPGVLLAPAAPAAPAALVVPGSRASTLALLVANQALAAVFSWMYARNASAGVRGATRAIERERELTALKDQFLIDANHELRTPIMAWYNNMELLHELGTRASDEQRARILTRAMTSGDAVLRMLRIVLDASALEAGAPQLTLRTVTLGPLVRSVFEAFDPAQLDEPGLAGVSWQSRPVGLTLPAEPLVARVDPDRVRQVLVNLLSNALKYSADDTPITLTVAPLISPMPRPRRWRRRHAGPATAPAAPRFAVLSVRDQGLGVPPREAPSLFQRFVRLERDITGPVRGTGVGLYLSRVLVEAMGGRIWVESAGVPGEGSTFSFTLPLAPTAAPEPGDTANMVEREPADAS